jgi:hypothetical protein
VAAHATWSLVWTRCPGHYDRRRLQVRRLLLFFGILLLLTAAATSFVPVPEEEAAGPTDTTTDEQPGEFQPDRSEPVELSFEVGGKPRTVDVELNQRVVLTVEAKEPGEVELEGLGRILNVDPTAPAVFDIFTDSRGLFDVIYTPVEGGERTVASVRVGPAPSEPESGATPQPTSSAVLPPGYTVSWCSRSTSAPAWSCRRSFSRGS